MNNLQWHRVAGVMIEVLLFLLLWLGSVYLAYAAGSVNLPLLRDVICEWETRDRVGYERDAAVGEDEELGRCQILPSTAEDLGIRFDLLARADVSRATALLLLENCERRLRNPITRNVARCYNGGLNSVSRAAYWYGKTMAVAYAERVRCQQWAPCQIKMLQLGVL